MGFFCFIGSCIKRAFLYQILIFFAVLRLLQAFRFHRDFKTRLSQLLKLLHLPQTLLSFQPKNSELVYKIFLITLIVLASLSILGIKFFQFISGLCCIFIAFLYYSPIKDITQLSNLKNKVVNDNLENYLPSLDFMVFASVGLGMIAHCFKCSGKKCDKKKEIKNDEINIELEQKNDKNKTDKKTQKKGKKSKKE